MMIFGIGKKGKEVKILDDFRGVTKPGEMVLVYVVFLILNTSLS
jgi:ATP-binding cassette subfamily G (WHITE) protein 2 (SNQ2)